MKSDSDPRVLIATHIFHNSRANMTFILHTSSYSNHFSCDFFFLHTSLVSFLFSFPFLRPLSSTFHLQTLTCPFPSLTLTPAGWSQLTPNRCSPSRDVSSSSVMASWEAIYDHLEKERKKGKTNFSKYKNTQTKEKEKKKRKRLMIASCRTADCGTSQCSAWGTI